MALCATSRCRVRSSPSSASSQHVPFVLLKSAPTHALSFTHSAQHASRPQRPPWQVQSGLAFSGMVTKHVHCVSVSMPTRQWVSRKLRLEPARAALSRKSAPMHARRPRSPTRIRARCIHLRGGVKFALSEWSQHADAVAMDSRFTKIPTLRSMYTTDADFDDENNRHILLK
jgi:hypothetical protein